MKKITCLLLFILALSGCTTSNDKPSISSSTESNFSLKEKCQKYEDVVKKRVEEENTKLENYQNKRIYKGTYYSKTEDTCISKVYYPSDIEGDDPDIMEQVWGAYAYTDELTGTVMYMYSESPPGYIFYTDKISGDEESTKKTMLDLENSLGLLL